jgi:hypothetical protein
MGQKNNAKIGKQRRILLTLRKWYVTKVTALLVALIAVGLLESGVDRQSFAGIVDLDKYGVPDGLSGSLERQIQKSIENIEKQIQKIEIPKPDGVDLRKFLVVEFTGGAMGDNMARVLGIMRNAPKRVFTLEAVRIEEASTGKGECELFSSRLWPTNTTCTESLVREIKELHRIGQRENAGSVASSNPEVGSNYYIPLVGYSEQLTKRYFDRSIEADINSLDRIESNWKGLVRNSQEKSIQSSQTGTTRVIEFRDILSIRWHIPLMSGVDETVLNGIVFEASRIPNVAAYTLTGERPKQPNFFTFTPNDVLKRREQGKDIDGVEGDYRTYLPGFYDTSSQIKCDGKDISTLEIIDTKVALNADLVLPLNVQPLSSTTTANTKPKVVDFLTEHHGTYLAGIVGSSENNAGFAGIKGKGISINSFPYTDVSDPEKILRNYLVESFAPAKLPVYLFASKFDDYPLKNVSDDELKKIWSSLDDQPKFLSDENVRFEYKDINGWIKSFHPLFVVAAGQNTDENKPGIAIEARVPMSPQNLGDLDNVIVVAACKECGKKAKLWVPSNYSGGDDSNHRYVHLLAPGGEEIPGLLSAEEIGTTVGGTSAAAAFVAGVVADALACYPSVYMAAPHAVKKWLMLTARPDADESLKHKTAAGMVDHSLAMLHPEKNWLKRDDRNVEEISKLNWCDSTLNWADEDNDEPPPPRLGMTDLRRLTRVGDDMRFVAAQLYVKKSGNYDNIRFEKFGPGRLDRQSPLALIGMNGQDSCAISASDIVDLIVAPDKDRRFVDCSAARRCDGSDQ